MHVLEETSMESRSLEEVTSPSLVCAETLSEGGCEVTNKYRFTLGIKCGV